jgi:RNA polymerase sigma factor (sigma-70 family)
MGSTDDERRQRFTDLYAAHYSTVVAYCRRRLPPETAADAVAETFMAAWRTLDRLSGDPLLWLYGVARGAVSNQRRGLQRTSRLRTRLDRFAALRPSPDPADDVGWEEPLLAALARLSSAEQEALRLIAWEGLALTEGAAVAGCSATAFKVRLFRARRHMRQLLDATAPRKQEVSDRRSLAVHEEGQ